MRPGIIHGDFHLANVLFCHDGPELAAWSTGSCPPSATRSRPRLAAGHLARPDGTRARHHQITVGRLPTPSELVDHYGECSDRDLDPVDWYAVLACYKLGIILEGTHARACAGKAPKETGDLLHAMTVGLFERALDRLG